MGLIFEWFLVDCLALVTVLLTALYFYTTRHFSYWQAKGVPFIKPIPILGNCKDLLFLRRTVGYFLSDIYNKVPGAKFIGFFIFDRPALLVCDPSIIKNILVKDFNYFSDRFTSSEESVDPLGSKNLFTRKGKTWKHLRMKITPTFTSGKMKNMYELVSKCFTQLMEHLNETSDSGKKIEIKDLLARCTTDIIASCAFGIDSNSIKNPNAEFREIGKKTFEYTIPRALETLVFIFVPSLVKVGKFCFFQKDVAQFLRKIVLEMIEYREVTKTSRNDFIDLLAQLKVTESKDKDRSDESEKSEHESELSFDFNGDDLAAQAAVFFTAGFETSASTMGFTLYELAIHPDIQTKLREEIVNTLAEHNGEITYENVHSMKYLDMVVSETLRKYPSLPFLDRICLKDYAVPGTNITIDKGTPIYIPSMAIHRNQEFYSDPENYNPEHFSEENKKSRISSAYLAFGEGPRNCIGMRFGLMTVKTGLVNILSRFEVQASEDTPIPLVMNQWAVILASVGGIPLILNKIN